MFYVTHSQAERTNYELGVPRSNHRGQRRAVDDVTVLQCSGFFFFTVSGERVRGSERRGRERKKRDGRRLRVASPRQNRKRLIIVVIGCYYDDTKRYRKDNNQRRLGGFGQSIKCERIDGDGV